MFKKMLLTALFCASTIATAQIQLDLDITITHEDVSRHITPVILVDEDVPASIEIANELVISLLTNVDGDIATIQTQFFQKTETDELITATAALTVQIPLGQAGTVTVTEQDGNGSLIMVVTPTQVE